MNEINSPKPWQCKTCVYSHTSGDFYICQLGVRENKVWGNSVGFGCTKWRQRDDSQAVSRENSRA